MLYVYGEKDIEIYLGNSGYIEFWGVLKEERSLAMKYDSWRSGDFENAFFRSLLTPEEIEE